MSGLLVKLNGVSKHYEMGGLPVPVLADVNLEVPAGERVALVGPSGCGKSTLLHLIGLLDPPTVGRITLDDQDVSLLADEERAVFRNRKIGFVFQAHHLLPEQSAVGNVMVPLRIAGMRAGDAQERAQLFLDAVGLSERFMHKPGQLSGGEQQRVAIARALVMGPKLVLADEPTGNLDPNTADHIMDLFLTLNQQLGSTLIVVTHSLDLAAKFPTTLRFSQGSFRRNTADHASGLASLPS